MPRPVALAVAVALGVAGVSLAAACGGQKDLATAPETVIGTLEAPTTQAALEGDPAAGKQVFASAGCTGCHTLADAGATGTVGPNLDETKPPLDKVLTRVNNGAGAMPAFKGVLTDQQIADVAAYVVKATSG
jgi:mono/diheme cytochrome c family protein